MSALLSVRGLVKEYPQRGARRGAPPFRAVDGVDLDLEQGTTLAIVGESGSGKSTTGRCVLRLIEPTEGSVRFDGTDLLSLDRDQLRRRRSEMQIVFQDTYASLDPRWTVGRLLAEPLRLHERLSRREEASRVGEMLEVVGLDASYADRYPHEFSGGQRQRIGIARALMLKPRLVVCDEPVSALDVSVQAQVLNLMKDLQDQLGLSYLFISHDIAVVEFMADDVIVMSQGRVVEAGRCAEVLADPQDPYTRALLAAVPVPDPDAYRDRAERRALIEAGLRAEATS
ncbi:ABC transporter ATP-binding protein [Microbacterium resistens]|uniref:ABC transporter ATP-binding protein n=1 Tax=Microbacterium resistens TaxID=156977 RepID=UPI0009FC3184|nr:ATP-binding cassette domain-containing protein [Microbacterium resistens]MBW1640171.1 ABC transporter ATP-binding protein [Microbacterium resistens]